MTRPHYQEIADARAAWTAELLAATNARADDIKTAAEYERASNRTFAQASGHADARYQAAIEILKGE